MKKSNLTIKTSDDSLLFIKGENFVKVDIKKSKKWENINKDAGIDIYIDKENKITVKQ